ncbi:eukaryotic translation initiation factor 4E-binding protein Mextli-like [Uloborus diversus]|uniref:eukaryotic translation initiation factor 4E-binding protein Mextli-like n=1 Tax=Uloborus diversus TaxID=327109 RepID=UPI002409ED5A|nr:eukaryotic translation initiation factor 4E-binding protein Mextli-like [Uloborus diversus]
MSAKTVRNVREPLKKPRPLKSTPSSEQFKLHIQDPKETVVQKSRTDILADLEILNVSISNCNFDEVTVADISRMCTILKKRGEELDSTNKDALDRYFCTLRNASREERLDLISRLKLLEIIEMRAMHWKMNENLTNYFNQKFQELEQGVEKMSISGTTSPSSPYPTQAQHYPTSGGIPLAPGEILRSSGKFAKPTKIAGKNYFKDEILIRNSDSGKVMGIKGRRVHMIEELSDTVISFQRVNPGARDRLVQITGPHEEAIGHAKILVEDTIRRNASPVREISDAVHLDGERVISDYTSSHQVLDNQPFGNKPQLMHSYSMSDATVREYNLPVYIGQDVLRLSGTRLELLKTARLVLNEYFAGQNELEKHREVTSTVHAQNGENIQQRFELKKQSSLKDNLHNSSTAGWTGANFRRDSVSPFSSSEDDVGKEERSGSADQAKLMKDYSVQSSAYSSPVPISDRIPTVQDKSTLSTSLPTEFVPISSSKDDFLPPSEELLSPSLDAEAPPIPPPSYKKHIYSREYLLQCANSPFSHKQPADYVEIHQSFPEIICQESKHMFSLAAYYQLCLEYC